MLPKFQRWHFEDIWHGWEFVRWNQRHFNGWTKAEPPRFLIVTSCRASLQFLPTPRPTSPIDKCETTDSSVSTLIHGLKSFRSLFNQTFKK